MAKKLRRVKSSNSSNSLFAWPKVLLVIIPLFAAVLVLFNSSNGRSVLGVSDKNLLNLNHEQKTATSSGVKCKQNKVISFSVTTLCDSNKNGFKQVSYVCADGTKGTTANDCISIQSGFERAMKACSKNSKCEKPKPIISPQEHLIPTGTGL